MMMARFVRIGVAACAAALALGCSREPAQSAAPPPPEQVYTVRGIIDQLPEPGRPASSLYIRHEAIDDFVAKDGRVIGMNAMTMPFPPADDLSLEGFQVGDVVEATFEVRWHSSPPSRLVRLVKLPPETDLVFRKAQPPE